MGHLLGVRYLVTNQDIAVGRYTLEGDLLDRTFRPEILNYFSAHPDIAPHVGGPLDFTNSIRETSVFLFGEHGGLMFEWCAPDTYEAHIMLTKQGRGAWGITATKEALVKLNAGRVWARIAVHNRALAIHAAICGFKRVETKTLWVGDDPHQYHIYEWSK